MSELEQLRDWKAQAMQVLAGWEAVWEAAGRLGKPGSVKSASVRAEMARLRGLAEDRDAVERASAAYYEHLAEGLKCRVSEGLRPRWASLRASSPEIADRYVAGIAAALRAAIGGADV